MLKQVFASGQEKWMPAVIACAILIGVAMWGSVLLPVPDKTRAGTGTTATAATTAPAFVPQVFRAWNGKLARFESGQEQPCEIYDTAVASLPAEAKEALKNGVWVNSEEELAAFLDD